MCPEDDGNYGLSMPENEQVGIGNPEFQSAIDNLSSLVQDVRKESNTADKLDKIAEVLNGDTGLFKTLYHDSRERHGHLMSEIYKTRKFFAAEFNSIADSLALISKRLEKIEASMATKEDISNLREEMQVSQKENREKFAALLSK